MISEGKGGDGGKFNIKKNTLDTMGGVETTTPFAVPMLAATLGVLISVLAVVKIGDR